jgi:uncharacterized phage-like protein YoqJ
MIIIFFGHSDFVKTSELEEKMMSVLQSLVADEPAELFFGGYGSFDRFALECGKKYKREHPNVKLSLVVPYLNREFDNSEGCDEIIYPPLEDTPPRFAISKRNQWMVEQADSIVAYVNRSVGGAFKALQYARRKNKPITNLAE